MATTITKALIRDCDKQTDTNTVFTSGETLYLSQLPTHWTIDFIASHSDKFYFSVDDGPQVLFEATPYCPTGHNTPLNLSLGSHKITVTIGTAPNQTVYTYTFTLEQAPVVVVTPPPPAVAIFGTNGAGIQDDNADPIKRPALLAACKAFNFEYMRLWTTGTIGTAFSSNYWSIPIEYAKAGIKTIAVLNFQNSKNRSQAPADADWLLTVNSIPNASVTGVWGFCIGNEIDTSAYYTGTEAQYAHLLALAYPILKAKGYVVIIGSTLLSMNYMRDLNKLGAFANCDYLDYHIYGGDVSGLALADEVIAYAASVNKPLIFSECGIRGTASNMSNWTSQTVTFFEGIKSRNVIACMFSCYDMNGTDPLGHMSPLDKTSTTPQQPWYATWQTITKG